MKTRYFSDQKFTLVRMFGLKKDAKKEQNWWIKNGYKTRVIKTAKGWEVYYR